VEIAAREAAAIGEEDVAAMGSSGSETGTVTAAVVVSGNLR
jgi:hypothetical protein